MAEGGWGTIPQTQNVDISWSETSVNKSNNLQIENWGTDRPSAPSENNWSAKKPVQETWGPNKSENSWISRNEIIQVDHSSFSNRPLHEKEPAKLSNNLSSANSKSASSYNDQREDEENLVIQTVIQRSYESFKDEGQFVTELDEDKWDPSYNNVPISSNKPDLDAYEATDSTEPLMTSSNSTLLIKEFRDVEVQTDPVDLSKIIASKESEKSSIWYTIDKKDYKQIVQDSSGSVTSEKSYTPQQSMTASLLDMGPEEWSRLNKSTEFESSENSWNTPSDKPDFHEGSAIIPHTKIDTNARALDNDSLSSKPIQTPSNDNWVSKSQSDNRSISQSIPVEPDSWGPAPPIQSNSWGPAPPINDNRDSKSQDQTSSQKDNQNITQQIPVRPDSWGPAPSVQSNSWGPSPPSNDNRDSKSQDQMSLQNDNRNITQQVPVQPDSWGSTPPVQSNTWGPAPPSNDNRDPKLQDQTSSQSDNQDIIQQIPVQIDSLEPAPPSNDNRDSKLQDQTLSQNDNQDIIQQIPVQPDSWGPAPSVQSNSWGPVPPSNDNRDPKLQDQTSSQSDNRNIAQQIPVQPDSWGSAPPVQSNNSWGPAPQSNDNRDPKLQDQTSSQSDNRNIAQKIPVQPDSWGSAPPVQSNSWGPAPPSNDNRDPKLQDQTSSQNDNRQQIPVQPDSWGSAPTVQSNSWPVQHDSRGTIPQQTPAQNNIIPQSAQDNRWDHQQSLQPRPKDTIPQEAPKESSWETIQQKAQNDWKTPQEQLGVSNDNWSGMSQQPSINKVDSWNKEPQLYETSAQANELPKKNADSWGTAPAQPTGDTWGNPQSNINKADSWPQPQTTKNANSNSWGTAHAQPAGATWGNPQSNINKADSLPQPQTNELPKNANSDSWGTAPAQPAGATWGASPNNFVTQSQDVGSSNDWTKQAEQFSKELGDTGEKNVRDAQWGQKGYEMEKIEDSYDVGAKDSFYDNFSSNNRHGNRGGCRNCGQEGHFARDCPSRQTGGRACHKCGKEGHIARECTEESGYGGGYGGGGKSCHKCGKEGHIARECTESGYGGGGRACHRCGKEGHIARECTEEGGYGGGYGGGGKSCHKCGKEGHIARECTEEGGYGGGYGGGGNSNACYKCNKPGHHSRDCNEDAYETTEDDSGFGVKSFGGRSRVHKPSPFSNTKPSDISSQDAWTELLRADKEQDLDDFKSALELYAKVTPEETFQSIEKKLREANCNGRIIAFERELLLNKVLVDLQGNTNKKYVANPIMCHPSRLPRTAGTLARNDDENLEWLANAGFMVDDTSPICFNCKNKGHTTKECSEPKKEIEKPTILGCQNCGSSEHMTKFCTQERRDYYAEARDRKVGGSHNRDSANEDRASSYDGEDDRKGFRGYGSNSSQTCHNCNREGHLARDCPEPRRGGRKCHKCGEEGHFSKDCSGGDYDRGNYNGNSGWQKDSSRNNNQTASWGTQDKSGDKSWNKVNTFQENSWNKSGGGDNQENSWSKSGGGNNIQESSWNKSSSDNITASRDDYRNTQNRGGNYSTSNDNTKDSSWTSRQDYNQPASSYNTERNDYTQPTSTYNIERNNNNNSGGDWDAQPENTARIDWGKAQTFEDLGWATTNNNKTSPDSENRQGRGNESKESWGGDKYNKGPDDYENRRGRGYEPKEAWGGDRYNKGPDDYDNRRGRGYESREARGSDRYNKGPGDYENRRDRGNESYNKSPDNDRWTKPSHAREPQEQITQSPQSNVNHNLDDVKAWW